MIIPLKTMDAFLICQSIKNDSVTKQYFYGAFPCDLAPTLTTYPASMILNTDPHNKPGEHWVALYFDQNKQCDYFDSFGMKPQENIQNYIDIYSTKFNYNNTLLQSFTTTTCGQFCMYFLFSRSRDVPMKQIVEQLNNRLADEIVACFARDVFLVRK